MVDQWEQVDLPTFGGVGSCGLGVPEELESSAAEVSSFRG